MGAEKIIPDRDLKQALLDVQTADDVLAAAARIEHRRRHPNTNCPADEIPTPAELAAWLTQCPDTAQAEAREAVAAMGLIGPTATGSVWSDTPGAGSPTDDPNEAIREVPLERWRWQAMGDPEARKAAEAELRESIGADIDFDAVLAILESNIAIVMRPRLVFMAPLRIDASGTFEPGAAGGCGICPNCMGAGATSGSRTGPGIRSRP